MWLILQETWDAMVRAEQFGIAPTAEQTERFIAARQSMLAGDSSRIMAVAGDTARIEVTGVLTDEPNFLAMLFGGGNTTYGEIVEALSAADKDDSVTRAELLIKSPGGVIDGLFEALGAIDRFSKPIIAVGRDVTASAAYALAAQTDSIRALNKAAQFGSVGVAASFQAPDDVVTLTSRMAPRKRPDPRTPKGQGYIQDTLDDIHELFADAIAAGRSAATGTQVTVDTVNKQFGRGAVVLAAEAQKRGMIDSVEGESRRPNLRVVNSGSSKTALNGGQSEVNGMDLEKLKAEYPDVYKAAVQIGTDNERDRVNAHIVMGKSYGCLEIAADAIEKGEPMTETLRAKYATASRDKADAAARAADDETADPGTGDAGGGDTGEPGAQVATLVEQRMGVTRPNETAQAGGA